MEQAKPNEVSPIAPAATGILLRLHHLQPDLPPTARRIAQYIAENGEVVLRMSVTEVAEQAAASEGSVISLCRRVGASGFQELKILLSRDLVEPIRMIQEDLTGAETVRELSARVFAAHVRSLSDTQGLLDLGSLDHAVDLLHVAERIEVYGIGSSAPIAMDLAYRLVQIGRRAQAVVESHVQAVSASMTDASTAVVTVSHSGSTVETCLATRLAKEAGATTIGLTRLGRSPLERFCDVVLHTVANETRFRPEAMSSRLAQLAIVDVLVSALAMREPKRSIAKLEQSARVIAEKRY
jgi:DNA-binding MurR/RpiR family transcriptional regulator